MEKIRANDINGSPLRTLSPEQLRWRQSGGILWEASMLLHAGKEEEANKRAAEGLTFLPAELRRVIAGGTSQK
jgi:hypothetical protein